MNNNKLHHIKGGSTIVLNSKLVIPSYIKTYLNVKTSFDILEPEEHINSF